MKVEEYTWDYLDTYSFMNKVAKGMPPLIIAAAITGGVHGKEVNPNLPETPEEQAEQTYDAYKAGASVVHVHARKPSNWSLTSADPEDYRKVNALIREKCPDIIINNTTGGAPTMSSEERMASLYANPEMASLNCGPWVYRTTLKARKPPLEGRPEDVFLDLCVPVSYADTELYAKTMKERGIKPEFEVYNGGQFWIANNLIRQNLIDPPYVFQFVMGFMTGTYPTPSNLIMMIQNLPRNSLFECIGVGIYQNVMTHMSVLMGGHVRVGMEDNYYIEHGKLADSNAQFVEKIARVTTDLGRKIATPKEARQMLGISDRPSQY